MRVLVTRPPAQAAGWVQSLQALGVDAAALPLLGIKSAVAVLFGQRLAKSKRITTTNWSLPRLSPQQHRNQQEAQVAERIEWLGPQPCVGALAVEVDGLPPVHCEPASRRWRWKSHHQLAKQPSPSSRMAFMPKARLLTEPHRAGATRPAVTELTSICRKL